MSERKRIVPDESGHWYLIPADKNEAWDEFLNSEDALDGVEPEWAERLNMHQSNYSFTDWREDR